MEQLRKLTLLLALLAALAISCRCTDAAPGAMRAQLTRTDAGRALTRRQLLRRMVLRSKARAARLLSGSSSSSTSVSASAVPGRSHILETEYLISFAIGTPPQPVQMTLDTGSDLIWTQCQPCPSCYAQALPYFDPTLSATSRAFACGSSECRLLDWSSCGARGWGKQTCVYTYSYGDNSVTNGVLAADTFTFHGGDAGRAGAAVHNVAYGCGLFNNGLFSANTTGSGIAGFGRGTLSLPSQLNVSNFSYCFTNITGSTPSTVLLGLPANLYSGASGAVQTTRLIQSSVIPTYYYLPLKSITVGSTRLPVPESAFALTDNGTGGTVIDSGTSVTLLPPPVYGLLHHAFVSQVNLTVTSDEPLCFAVSSSALDKPAVPKLELQFEGAKMELPRDNYVFELEDGGQNNMCIAIVSSGGDMTIIGNYQQQNLHVLYDLAGNKLSFVTAQCDSV
ncbi:hypothetical protein BS78_01G372300 [Paspalum vaginatum]|nr:hypothetical protein BS78_01G372300 [Paspalum vaginatum]